MATGSNGFTLGFWGAAGVIVFLVFLFILLPLGLCSGCIACASCMSCIEDLNHHHSYQIHTPKIPEDAGIPDGRKLK